MTLDPTKLCASCDQPIPYYWLRYGNYRLTGICPTCDTRLFRLRCLLISRDIKNQQQATS